MDKIVIRIATEDDAALIAEISRETFYDSFAEQNTQEDMAIFMEKQFSTTLLVQELFDPANKFFLAYYEEELAGYMKLKPGSYHDDLNAMGKAIEISRFYARKHTIGKGIGKAMMQYALKYAKDADNKAIWLGVWEHNKRAIDFYKAFGFQKFSEHNFLLGKDVQRDWLMVNSD